MPVKRKLLFQFGPDSTDNIQFLALRGIMDMNASSVRTLLHVNSVYDDFLSEIILEGSGNHDTTELDPSLCH